MKKIFYCVICCMFFSISCSEESDVISAFDDSSSTKIQLKKGLLVFPNARTLYSVLQGNKNTQMEQYDLSFVSQKDIMDEIVKADQEKIAYLKTLTEEELEKVEKHSDLYYKYLKEGVIKQVFYEDGSFSYDLNLVAPNYAKVLNKEGFFAVGDTIYQVTGKYKKIWIGGDIDNYTLLDAYTESDILKGIYVYDYTQQATELPVPGLSRTEFPIQIKDQNVGMYRYSLKEIAGDTRFAFQFYDRTVPQFATQSYIRDTYCRVIVQEGIPGTNPKQYTYKSVSYDYVFVVWIIENGKEVKFGVDGRGIGYNDYYTVYTPYKMIVAGKESLNFSGDYYLINRIDCRYYWQQRGEGIYSGVLAVADVGIVSIPDPMGSYKYFMYPWEGDTSGRQPEGSYWLTENIPD